MRPRQLLQVQAHLVDLPEVIPIVRVSLAALVDLLADRVEDRTSTPLRSTI